MNSDDESPAEPWVRGHAHIVFRRGRGWKPWLHQHSTHTCGFFFYLMISSRTRNQKLLRTIMWIYVDINTWCVVFHIDEHVMCGLSSWWTRACVSFVLALCCNFLYSSCFFKKWNLDILNLKKYKMTYFYYLWVIVLYRSRIKLYG